MITTSATRASALDFMPRSLELSEPLEPLWSVRVPYHRGRTRLASYESSLVLVEPERGVVEVTAVAPTGDQLDGWTRYALPLETVGAGAASPAALVDDSGAVYRWVPGSAPRMAWAADVPANSLIVLGMPNEDLVVQRERDGRWTTARVHGPSNRTRWEIAGSAAILLPHEDLLLLELSDAPDVIRALDARTGRERWSTPRIEGGLLDIIGVVGPSLWVTTRVGSVRSFSLEDGRPRTEVALEGVKVPHGVLDEHGVFHVCTGYDIQLVDLVGKGRLVTHVAFERDDQSGARAKAFGGLALTTCDGRLIYHDERGRVFAVMPNDRAHPRLVWQGDARIAMLGGASGALFALGSDGVLRAFGEGEGEGS